jgi:hypothetical protein
MTPRPGADGHGRRACLLPGRNTVLGTPYGCANACAPGAVPSTDPDAAPHAAVAQTVAHPLVQNPVRARARGLLLCGSKHVSRLVGLLAQLRVGSLSPGALMLAGVSPQRSRA